MFIYHPLSGVISVDTSVEWPKTKIWGWAKGLLCCSFIFISLSH